jgi:nucleotide-binding universal stress UspA family protein
MKRILFPTDFSDAASTAFMYALRFADSFEAELVVLHVYDLPIVETPPLPESTKEIFDIVEMNQFESFREQLPEMHEVAEKNQLGHVKMRNILLYGDLIYNINKVCADEEIDLIVMGTKGATGLKETFLGSTTASVIANAKVPVLGIPVEAEYHPINNIGFTTQYKDKDSNALTQALNIARKFKAKIQCLYIAGTDDQGGVEERIEEWKMYYKNDNIFFHVLKEEDKEQAILSFISDSNLDMLVMCTHKRSFFEGLFHKSLTKKMAYHSTVPLLIYHADK